MAFMSILGDMHSMLLKGDNVMEIFEDLFQPSFLQGVAQNRPRFPKDASVTMAYVPLQESLETYDLEKGLAAGTIYPQLDKVFKGRMVKK